MRVPLTIYIGFFGFLYINIFLKLFFIGPGGPGFVAADPAANKKVDSYDRPMIIRFY